MIDQDRSATRPSARLDVSPPVSNNETSTEIDVQVARGSQQHAWPGLTTVTAIQIVVVTFPHIVKRNAAAQEAMYLLDSLARQLPTGSFGRVPYRYHKPSNTSQ